MLYPVTLRANGPLFGTYGWPPHEASPQRVETGGIFTTDNETAERILSRGDAEKAERIIPMAMQPSDEVAAMIRNLKAKMAKPPERAVMEHAPENKMLAPAENKSNEAVTVVKRGRGRPKGSRNRPK